MIDETVGINSHRLRPCDSQGIIAFTDGSRLSEVLRGEVVVAKRLHDIVPAILHMILRFIFPPVCLIVEEFLNKSGTIFDTIEKVKEP